MAERVGITESSAGQGGGSRYTVWRVDNHQWGGVQWAIWDNKLETWADDFGRYMTEVAARRAISSDDGGRS